LSARCAQGVLLEHAKGKRQLSTDGDPAVVWRASPYRAFGLFQPRPDWKLELFQTFAPHDSQLLVECKGKTWNPLIEHGADNPKIFFIEESSSRQVDRWHITSAEGFTSTEFADPFETAVVELGNPDHEIEGLFVQALRQQAFPLLTRFGFVATTCHLAAMSCSEIV
jgi:hypothetical protein